MIIIIRKNRGGGYDSNDDDIPPHEYEDVESIAKELPISSPLYLGHESKNQYSIPVSILDSKNSMVVAEMYSPKRK